MGSGYRELWHTAESARSVPMCSLICRESKGGGAKYTL